MLTTGAEPLFFLDYVAANTIDAEQVAQLVEGAADVCRAAGCAILGGETAELPGIYREGEIDFCGTCVGLVERERLIDGSRVEPATPWSGSPRPDPRKRLLARPDIVGDGDSMPSCCCRRRGCTSRTFGPARPRRCARARARHRWWDRRQPRTLSARGMSAVVDPGSWERPPVFAWLADQGVAEEELRRVFNIGIGYCVVVPAGTYATVIRDRLHRRRGRHSVGRRVGVLVSGEGSNLQALLDAGVDVAAVAANMAGARALGAGGSRRRADAVFPLDEYADRDARDLAMADWLERHGVDLVVCAGYMHLLRPRFLERFPDAVVNVHPALLPAFPGAHAVDDALEAGVRETGATVHLVDAGVDTGRVLRQERVPIVAGDTRESLHARIREVEHRLLPEVVKELAGG